MRVCDEAGPEKNVMLEFSWNSPRIVQYFRANAYRGGI